MTPEESKQIAFIGFVNFWNICGIMFALGLTGKVFWAMVNMNSHFYHRCLPIGIFHQYSYPSVGNKSVSWFTDL